MSLSFAVAHQSALMYGINDFQDHCRSIPYDPWVHAEMLGAPIVSNMTLPEGTPAAYAPELHTIFFRADLPEDVERCAIAHELVHFEHRDQGNDAKAEARANKISTLRLIRPSDIEELALDQSDLHQLAIELRVTENVMRLYARMARNGTLPRSY